MWTDKIERNEIHAGPTGLTRLKLSLRFGGCVEVNNGRNPPFYWIPENGPRDRTVVEGESVIPLEFFVSSPAAQKKAIAFWENEVLEADDVGLSRPMLSFEVRDGITFKALAMNMHPDGTIVMLDHRGLAYRWPHPESQILPPGHPARVKSQLARLEHFSSVSRRPKPELEAVVANVSDEQRVRRFSEFERRVCAAANAFNIDTELGIPDHIIAKAISNFCTVLLDIKTALRLTEVSDSTRASLDELEPGECLMGSVRRLMKFEEVRDLVSNEPLVMRLDQDGRIYMFSRIQHVEMYSWTPGEEVHRYHPANDEHQLRRIQDFYEVEMTRVTGTTANQEIVMDEPSRFVPFPRRFEDQPTPEKSPGALHLETTTPTTPQTEFSFEEFAIAFIQEELTDDFNDGRAKFLAKSVAMLWSALQDEKANLRDREKTR